MAGESPAKVAAGILFGLLDAADALGDSVAEVIEHAAMAAGNVGVRLAALRRLAGRDPEAARARAETDP